MALSEGAHRDTALVVSAQSMFQTPLAALTLPGSILLGIFLLPTRVSDLCPALWAGFTALPRPLCCCSAWGAVPPHTSSCGLCGDSEGENTVSAHEPEPDRAPGAFGTLGDGPVQARSWI